MRLRDLVGSQFLADATLRGSCRRYVENFAFPASRNAKMAVAVGGMYRPFFESTTQGCKGGILQWTN